MSRLLMGLETEDEFLMLLLEDPAGYIQERFSARWIDEENGIQAIYGLKTGESTPTVFALLFMRSKGWTRSKALDWLGENPECLPRKIREALAEYWGEITVLRLLRDPKPFVPEFFKVRAVDKAKGIHSLLGVTTESTLPQAVALIFSGKAWTKRKVSQWWRSRQGTVFRRRW